MDYPISFLTASVLWFGIFLLVIWSVIWKGVALWHSAKHGHKIWFIALMFINTAGLLEIIYLSFIAKIWTKKEAVTMAPATPASPVATPVPPAPVATPVLANQNPEQSTTTDK